MLIDPVQEQQSFRSPTVIPTPDKSTIVHGIKDACADDALWLVSSIVSYVKETGDYRPWQTSAMFPNGTCPSS